MPYIKELVIHGFKSFARETRIPFRDTMNVIVGPNGSGKSCSYDTKVLLSDGREVEIGKIIEEKIKNSDNIKTLKDGIYVEGDDSLQIISLNKNTGKSENKKISKFIKRDGEIIYKIKTRSGKEVKATGCHPVMTFKDEQIKSVLIKDLKENSLIASPRVITTTPSVEFEPELARLIGYIIGDGYLAKDRIEFINKDPEIIEDFKGLVEKYFNISGKGLRERREKNATRLYFVNKTAVNKIKDFFYKDYSKSITSSIKKIPEILFATKKETIASLLAGLYDTDGSVRKDIGIIEFCSKNKNLVNQMQGLLLRFGITSKIKKRLCCAINTEHKIKRPYFYLYIYGSGNLKKFYNNIHLKINYKKEAIRKHISANVIQNNNVDILPREINLHTKELTRLLGLKYKPLRKQYPSLAAYIENRCCPTKQGIKKIIQLFNIKLIELQQKFSSISKEQINLVNCMDSLNMSSQQVSNKIGLHSTIIRNQWATGKFNPKQENLNNFYNIIKETFEIRFARIAELMNILNVMASSDIFWDEIISIEKLEKEPYVYDLTIEDNHNFIANNLFVHNSNVTDAICFVLGRLGSKSMRAKKLSNLIFAGTSKYKPASEASVEMVFDNSDKGFSVDDKEVSIKRILRRNGQGIYKINGDIKTRQEVLELLAQGGIDPNGFNLVLQGEIDAFVKMPPDQRREVIEEVAGISIYEIRKQRSLKELEKTEQRLKEVSATLRERNAYLRNLEQERKQALKFKKLQQDVKDYKASILHKTANEKQEKIEGINREIKKNQSEISKINELIEKNSQQIAVLNQKIEHITNDIQKSSGIAQEKLNNEISDLRADLAGLEIKKQTAESQANETKKRKQEILENIKNLEQEIKEMSATKAKGIKQNLKSEIDEKKKKLEEIDEKRRKLYQLKSNLNSINPRLEDKKRQIQKNKNESDFVFNRIEEIESEIKTKEPEEQQQEVIAKLKSNLIKFKQEIEESRTLKTDSEKSIAAIERQIQELNKVKDKVSSLDVCPLCKSKMTKEHVGKVVQETQEATIKYKKEIQEAISKIKESESKTSSLNKNLEKSEQELGIRTQDVLRLDLIKEKKSNLKSLKEESVLLEKEYQELETKRKTLENQVLNFKTSEEGYDSLRLEVQELERTHEKNVGMDVTLKQRDVERLKNVLRQATREIEEQEQELIEATEALDSKQEALEEKNEKDQELKRKFKKVLEEKNAFQEKIRFFERDSMHKQNNKQGIEEKTNNLKITRAQLLAQKEAAEHEASEFKGSKIMRLSVTDLKARLEQTERILSTIGSVNMRSLEVYEDVKKEYEKIEEKANVLVEEKDEILKIIEDIDKKKKKVFVQTLKQINELFSRNFSQLSTKGEATLVPANKEDMFKGGIEMLIKVGKGKYFDTHSLSGGEKSLVSLALIFAIQEYKPYCFYIFDEIDAALDRRNSERLANLLRKYMKAGQYIIITHNDSLITEAPTIYGVSMQDKISQVLSLEV